MAAATCVSMATWRGLCRHRVAKISVAAMDTVIARMATLVSRHVSSSRGSSVMSSALRCVQMVVSVYCRLGVIK